MIAVAWFSLDQNPIVFVMFKTDLIQFVSCRAVSSNRPDAETKAPDAVILRKA